jgi:methionyl-tRNA formyltransferase
MNRLKLVLAGTHIYSYEVYKLLIKVDLVDIVGILPNKSKVLNSEEKQKNKSYKFQVLNKFPKTEFKTIEEIKQIKPDLLLSIMYNQIFSKDFIELFSKGCWNLHPGILPDYRGRNIFYWTIMNDEKKCGVTFHEIVEKVDAGKILSTVEYRVDSDSTPQTLFVETRKKIAPFTIKMLSKIISEDYNLVENEISKGKIFNVASVNYNNLVFNLEDYSTYMSFNRHMRAFFFPLLDQYPSVLWKGKKNKITNLNMLETYASFFESKK